ncbi:MAG: tetraacyldisaccharide 4'-kinase [Acidithiobacillus sp.]
MGLVQRLEREWYAGGPLAEALRPLGTLTCALAGWRRRHRRGRAGALPSLVVGNLTVGGNGKTPLTLAIGHRLQDWGVAVAVVSRGHGAHPPTLPYRVPADDSPARAGDEPLLLAQTLPVYLSPRRHAGIAAAAAAGFRWALLDDGFQHLALKPDLRLLVFAGTRPLGNGRCLPAGPLREPICAAEQADAVLLDDRVGHLPLSPSVPQFRYRVQVAGAHRLGDPKQRVDPRQWCGQRFSAVTGIARPERFLDTLNNLGVEAELYAFADHHAFRPKDLEDIPRPLVMTAKDAVKCEGFAGPDDWVLQTEAEPEPAFWEWLHSAIMVRS